MASSDSSQAKNLRNRPGRVNLVSRVYEGDAYTEEEVPFVVGVVGNFRGNASPVSDSVADRAFVNVRPDTFDDVMKGMRPAIQAEVPNRLQDDGSKLKVKLSFEKFSDLTPDEIVRKVPELNELHKARARLKELRSRLSGNSDWRKALERQLKKDEGIQQLKRELESGQK
jgi:type VI secretion system protein ImpB